ncbi:MAG: histidine kinase [Cyclobacteriaceae bacterium]|nr:histidine kinase [Cyclobacteriaceae bacterium]
MKQINPNISPRLKRIGLHFSFWLLYVLYHTILFGYMRQDFLHPLKYELYDLPVKIAASYFVAYFLIPKFLFPRKIWSFAATLALTLLTASFLQRLFHSQVIGRFIEPEQEYFTLYPTTGLVFKTVISIYPIVVLVALIKILKHWYEQDRKHQNIYKEKVEAELNYLKSQIHPHFLFNTLNSLYALTLKKSNQASKVVLKLSHLLHYLLYDSNKQTVPVEKELELIENYISLEKIRFGNRLDLSYNFKGSMEGTEIAPLLLLPFVENSFKHGAGNQLEEVWVDIQIVIEDNTLNMKIYNSKETSLQPNENAHDGIGLHNVNRRLELIYGKGNYKMLQEDKGDRYLVELQLKTQSITKEN